MLIPDKLTDPNNCLVYYGYLIIKHLKSYQKLKFNTLEQYLSKNISDFSQDLFISALCFLHLFERIDYNPDEDFVEFKYEIK